MMRTSLLTAAIASIAVLTTALPAHAEKLALKDATGDVWEADQDTISRSDERINIDLKKSTLTHSESSLDLDAKYADLRRNAKGRFALTLEIRDNESDYTYGLVLARSGKPQGRASLSDDTGERVRCPDLDHKLSYGKESIALSIPRTCLGEPTWVRARIGAARIKKADAETVYFDDASSTRAFTRRWTERITVG